jgi:hypothetical protein
MRPSIRLKLESFMLVKLHSAVNLMSVHGADRGRAGPTSLLFRLLRPCLRIPFPTFPRCHFSESKLIRFG